jgi:hypothetical protein
MERDGNFPPFSKVLAQLQRMRENYGWHSRDVLAGWEPRAFPHGTVQA